ncbi:MAG: hypothetical protein ACLR8Y_19000 [Alistipes indistinctus]
MLAYLFVGLRIFTNRNRTGITSIGVNIPKANGYEARSTPPLWDPTASGSRCQIRSQRMEEIAERGFAAHWKYKSTDAEGRDEGESRPLDQAGTRGVEQSDRKCGRVSRQLSN